MDIEQSDNQEIKNAEIWMKIRQPDDVIYDDDYIEMEKWLDDNSPNVNNIEIPSEWGEYLGEIEQKHTTNEYKEAEELFDLLVLKDECKNPHFIKWLMDNKHFLVEKSWNRIGDKIYEFEYDGPQHELRNFDIIDGKTNAQHHITAMREIMKYYDQYKREESNAYVKDSKYKEAKEAFDVLVLEDECKNSHFIKWLMDNKHFYVDRLGLEGDKTIKFQYDNPTREGLRHFNIIDGEIGSKDQVTAMHEIRGFYDQYKKEKLNYKIKKAGIATAIGISLIATITGLALGLKRKGKDLVRNAHKAKKIVPGLIPWSEIENASGEGLVFIGDHIYLVIGGTLIYLYTK